MNNVNFVLISHHIDAVERSLKRSKISFDYLQFHESDLLGFLRVPTVSLYPGELLEPFLGVVKSPETNGKSTEAALGAIQSFIQSGTLSGNGLKKALLTTCHSVTRSKFEATDSTSDELVLSRILKLLSVLVSWPLGIRHIDDKSICEMIEVAFGMHFQSRISELLRKNAEETLMDLVQVVFERLSSISSPPLTLQMEKTPLDKTLEGGEEKHGFGLPAIHELLRCLVSLLDPKNKSHTDSLHRTLALKLITKACQVSGPSLSKWISYGFYSEINAGSKHFESGPELDMRILTETVNTVVSVSASGGVTESSIVDIGSPKLGVPSLDSFLEKRLDIPEPFLEKPHSLEKSAPDSLEKNHDKVSHDKSDKSSHHDANTLVDSSSASSLKKQHSIEIYDESQKMGVAIKDLITDDLCRFLFQLLQLQNGINPSYQTLSFLSQVLSTISSLFQVCPHLVLQRQWLISYFMRTCEQGVVGWDIEDWSITSTFQDAPKPRLDRDRPLDYLAPEVREMYLEALVQIIKTPGVFAELVVYHDGNLEDSSQLFEELLLFLAKAVFPDATPGGPATSIVHQNVALDGILVFLKELTDRRKSIVQVPSFIGHTPPSVNPGGSERVSKESLDSETLFSNKQRKRILVEGSEKFNVSVKTAIPYFQEHGFLPDPLTPESLAKLLCTTPNLNKKAIGEYLAKPTHTPILQCFVRLFDFHGKRIDEAMRVLLDKFRLPGESQQIERIMEAFSKCYFQSIVGDPGREITSEDDTTILAFSIIMLNTDQHNPQVSRRMTLTDYTRNVRGLNSGKDFSPDYLKDIYTAIRHDAILIAEEHGGELGFNHQWKNLIYKRPLVFPLSFPLTNVYDQSMFLTVWGPTLASLFYTFENAEEMYTLQRSVVGIQRCAILASHYGLNQVLDYILISLSRMTGFLKPGVLVPERDVAGDPLAGKSDDKLEKSLEFRKRGRLDRWVLEVGKSYRVQVSGILMFHMASEYGNLIMESWTNVKMYKVSLLVTEDVLKPLMTIPRYIVKKPVEVDRKDTTGLFSTLSQFLSLASQGLTDFEDETNESLEFEKRAGEIVAGFKVEALLDDSRYLGEPALLGLLDALVSNSVTKGEMDEYTPQSVFLLELMFHVALRNRDRISLVWSKIGPHVKSILTHGPSVLIERAVVNSVRVMMRMHDKEDMQVLVFQSLSQLSKLSSPSERIVVSLFNLAKSDPGLLVRGESRAMVFGVLNLSASTNSLAAFELACLLIQGPESPVTAESFGECVDLLMAFAASSVNVSTPRSGPNSPRLPRSERPPIMVERGLRAIDKLSSLCSAIPSLVSTHNVQVQRAWYEFWLPVLSGLSQQCYHPSKEVRQHALVSLQRVLLSPELYESDIVKLNGSPTRHQIHLDCLETVLFPLLEELMKPELSRMDPAGIDETRMRSCALLAKVFLRFYTKLDHSLERVWSKMLDVLGHYMTAGSMGREEVLNEGVQESLKNCLLVLVSDGALSSSSLVDTTRAKLTLYCPLLLPELEPLLSVDHVAPVPALSQ